MGYTTDFEGKFDLNKTLDLETFNLLKEFADERHEGEEFPGLYCQWIPSEDGNHLEWDGNEKFYSYIDWLKYLMENILIPRGYVLSGETEWVGEEHGDFGKIVVENNEINVKQGKIVYD